MYIDVTYGAVCNLPSGGFNHKAFVSTVLYLSEFYRVKTSPTFRHEHELPC